MARKISRSIPLSIVGSRSSSGKGIKFRVCVRRCRMEFNEGNSIQLALPETQSALRARRASGIFLSLPASRPACTQRFTVRYTRQGGASPSPSSRVFRFLPIFRGRWWEARGWIFVRPVTLAERRPALTSSLRPCLRWTRRKKKKRGIYIYIFFIRGEVFLDSRGFTVKLGRYTGRWRVVFPLKREREVLVNAVIFVCNASRRGLEGMKNARMRDDASFP